MLCAVQVYDEDTETSLWVAADGTKFNFGDIVDEDLYDPNDPEGGQLFETDDEPDDENYERYTGNAGVLTATIMGSLKTPGLRPRDRPRSPSPKPPLNRTPSFRSRPEKRHSVRLASPHSQARTHGALNFCL